MKDSSLYNKYICDMCKNNYNASNFTNSYINCFEPKEPFYTDTIFPNFISCYYSCKSCEIEGNETHNNCI